MSRAGSTPRARFGKFSGCRKTAVSTATHYSRPNGVRLGTTCCRLTTAAVIGRSISCWRVAVAIRSEVRFPSATIASSLARLRIGAFSCILGEGWARWIWTGFQKMRLRVSARHSGSTMPGTGTKTSVAGRHGRSATQRLIGYCPVLRPQSSESTLRPVHGGAGYNYGHISAVKPLLHGKAKEVSGLRMGSAHCASKGERRCGIPHRPIRLIGRS